MIWGQTAAMMMTMLIPVSGYAANPFLDTPDDKPISAKFGEPNGATKSEEKKSLLLPRSDDGHRKNVLGRDFQIRI